MKIPRIINSIGHIDDDLITATVENEKKAKRRPYIKWSVIAACFAVLVTAGTFILPEIKERKVDTDNQSEKSRASIVDIQEVDIQENQNSNTIEGVHIPAIALPQSADDSAMSMIGLVVYQGRIYTQAESYWGETSDKIKMLLGEHLGTAKGNIDEWSSQDEYTTEFASNVTGEVYSVIGYDTDFRICIYSEVEDENHNPTVWIKFLDCLNDITLKTGADLFEDRLHIREKTESIQFQNHDDWDWGRGNIQSVNIDSDKWTDFWNQVDNGEIINTWNSDNSIYDTENQAHLILSMNDGSVVRLRLIEGGYVGYDYLGWYFVKIPEEIFNEIYDVCGGTR